MSTRQRMIAAVIAKPGITLSEIAIAIGKTDRKERTGLSAQLSQLCQKKKLRKDTVLNGSPGAIRYWPTATSAIDGRSARKRPAMPEATTTAAAKTAAPRQSDKAKRAGYASPKAMPQKPASQVRIVDPPRERAPAAPAGDRETVEEFQARGGRIEILHPHACSPNSILRFDHAPKPHASARPMTATRVRPSASR